MTVHAARPELLVLHAVRLQGMATAAAAAGRYGLDEAVAEELLLDFQALGWVTWAQFAGTGGWFLTEAGRSADERHLAQELQAVEAEPVVRSVHARFLPLNARLQRACTDWQLRPVPGDPLAENDHTDAAWDTAVLDELAALSAALTPLARDLASVLPRFDGYDDRFVLALRRAAAGDRSSVDSSDRDSCHTVWFQLHEDLLNTLGIERSQEGSH